jgi:hypothetical protein
LHREIDMRYSYLMTTTSKTVSVGDYIGTLCGDRVHLWQVFGDGEQLWFGAKLIKGSRLDCYEVQCPLEVQKEIVLRLKAA